MADLTPLTDRSRVREKIQPTEQPDPPPLLSDRVRWILATILVILALLHVVFPALAIDAIFLGLLAFAGLVLLFDIDSVEWLGVKAKRRALRRQAAAVQMVTISDIEITPSLPEVDLRTVTTGPEVVHGPPDDLMPPIDRVERLRWAAEQIKIELVLIAGNGGQLQRRANFADYRATELASSLASKNLIPEALVEPIASVFEQRNAVTHMSASSRSLIEGATQLGLEVLVKLREVKRNWNRVRDGQIALFLDRSLSVPHPASRGVMIEQVNNDGVRVNVSVFPASYSYQPGRFVTWEWELTHVFKDETWYKDPDSGLPKMAFSSAALFAGREYPDQWGIQYRIGGPLEL